jgi:hypothetical protein
LAKNTSYDSEELCQTGCDPLIPDTCIYIFGQEYGLASGCAMMAFIHKQMCWKRNAVTGNCDTTTYIYIDSITSPTDSINQNNNCLTLIMQMTWEMLEKTLECFINKYNVKPNCPDYMGLLNVYFSPCYQLDEDKKFTYSPCEAFPYNPYNLCWKQYLYCYDGNQQPHFFLLEVNTDNECVEYDPDKCVPCSQTPFFQP